MALTGPNLAIAIKAAIALVPDPKTFDAMWTAIAQAIIDQIKTAQLINIQRFVANGTYTPTPGTTAIRMRIVGSGGGGGPATSIAGAAGGGGSSGEWAEIWYAPGTAIVGGAVTIGAAATSSNNGNQSTVVADSITFGAAGGNAGALSTTVASYAEANAPSLGTVGNTSFDIARGSNASVAAMASSTTTIAGYTGGIGGGTPYGAGGRGSGGDADGAAGVGFGTGGGGGRRGAATNRAGGNSAPGIVIIEEYCLK